jgi:hypothetical protein
MSKTDIRKDDDAKKPTDVKSTQDVRAKSDAPAWKATFSKRLPHRFGEPLSSSSGSDTIQY